MSAHGEPFISLRTKLIAFAVALVVLPGGIYGVIAVLRSRADLERVVGRQLVAEARNAADGLAAFLRMERERLRSLARQDLMREIRVADVDKRISSFLAAARQGCAECVDLSVVPPDGRVVASSDPTLLGSTLAPIEGIEGPAEVPGHAGPVLRLGTPIPDPDVTGAVLGHLLVRYDWARTMDVVTRVRQSLGTVDVDVAVFVVDGSRHVIGGVPTRHGPWRLGSTVLRRSPETTPVASLAHVDRPAAMLVGEAGLPADLPGWRIIVAEPLRSAFAPAYRTAVMLGTALGLTLLGALGVAVWAARRVTEPLADLTQAAARIGRGGEPTSPVAIRSRDEIGMLARAFNRMHVDLRRAEQELIDAAKFAFVGELAAGVAHEVRTPLGVMRSATQLIERALETRDERVRELAHLLREEVDRIERVVSELLQLARPRALRVEPCEIGQVVFRAADFVETQASEKKIRVCRSARTPDPVALCDPDLVYQVALNLLVNAVQVLPAGGTIEVGVADPVDGLVGFFVRDDGPGLAPDVRDRIFEPFFTRRDGGVGLGLTFVRRVVDEHRGRVHVESAPGHGVAFHVHLPAAGAV